MTASHSSSVMLKIIRSRRMPALLTTMSIRPKWSSAVSDDAWRRPPSWSPIRPLGTRLPASRLDLAGDVLGGDAAPPLPSAAAARSFTTTRAPCFAMRSAISRPMPRPRP